MGRIGAICARFHSGSAEVRMILQRPCATWSALARCVERLGAVLACVDEWTLAGKFRGYRGLQRMMICYLDGTPQLNSLRVYESGIDIEMGQWGNLSNSLQSLLWEQNFNQSLEQVPLPSSVEKHILPEQFVNLNWCFVICSFYWWAFLSQNLWFACVPPMTNGGWLRSTQILCPS